MSCGTYGPVSGQGINADDHLHHYDRFLYDIADSCPNQLQQYIDASFGGGVDFNGSLTDSLDALPYEIDIHF